jgi:hypothetical protein
MIRKWKSAPPDPGITPGGIRDRALHAALARGQQPEDRKARRAQEYWSKYRAARAKPTSTDHQPHDPSEINHGVRSEVSGTGNGMRWRELWEVMRE